MNVPIIGTVMDTDPPADSCTCRTRPMHNALLLYHALTEHYGEPLDLLTLAADHGVDVIFKCIYDESFASMVYEAETYQLVINARLPRLKRLATVARGLYMAIASGTQLDSLPAGENMETEAAIFSQLVMAPILQGKAMIDESARRGLPPPLS